MAASSSYSPVHQLWPPPEGIHRTELDVVFFHGVQFTGNDTCDPWISTWTQRGHDDVCWAREWLPFDLGKAVRIFSVSYNAHVASSPHGHVTEIAENLVQSLINSGCEWDHPIVLIGHSFGGLVLKSLVVNLKWRIAIDSAINPWSKATVQRAKMFLRNVRGVAFYAVPHAGSSNFAEYVKKLSRCNRHNPGIMDNIRPWQRDMEKLSVDFEDIVNGNEINIFAFCEGRPIMERVGILVECSSAQRSARNNYYTVEDADHMEVCKPPSDRHPSYTLLVQFINDCRKMVRDCNIQEIHDLPEVTFGLEMYVEKVATLVLSEESDADPRYVGIWGMGGVGKTLLLQTLYGSEKVHGHFQGSKFIWRTVGRTPDIMTLYRGLSAELGLNPELYVNAEEDYKLKLQTQFRLRRVFLVLDDVWQDKIFDSLDLAKGKGSVTLLSTRNQFLFRRSRAHIEEVQMTRLSKEDSWSLFSVHAFRRLSHVPYELEELARLMAEQCQGLPLALKVIGSAMIGKTSPELEWESMLKKLRESRMQERTVEDELYERLKVGYDLLSEDDERLKDCFLYFAAFPEDYEIDFEGILWYWIAEGLVPAHDGDDPKADAFSLLSMLWERSFIEKHGEAGWGDVLFNVHDVMRDLAFYILENDCGTPPAKQLYLYRPGQNLEEIPREWKSRSKALRLSLMRNNMKKLPESFNAPELVFLLLGDNPIQCVPASFFINFSKLRVLDLSYGLFASLPEELGDLNNLIYLSLFYCYSLQTLPDTVGKLHMLKHLDIGACGVLNLPYELFGLTSLQSLYTMGSGFRWTDQTSAGMVRAESMGYEYPTTKASSRNIWGLVGLTELHISGKMNPGVKLPHNISALTNLKLLRLELDPATLPAEMPYWFKQLQELELFGSYSLENLPSSFTHRGAFPSLIRFELYMCATLVEFPYVHEGALPQLRTLQFSGCKWLRKLPLSLDKLSNLRKLFVSKCTPALRDSCRENCEKSSIWRKFNIRYEI